jgi:hypothetical protein
MVQPMHEKIKLDTAKIGKTEWTWEYKKWEHGERIRGVSIKGKKLEWWSEAYPGYSGGFHCTQNIEDFLHKGPNVDDVPDHIVREMKETIEKAIQE